MFHHLDPALIRQFWSKGLSLDEARWRYANPEIARAEQAKLKELEKNPDMALEGLPDKDWDEDGLLKTLKDAAIAFKPVTVHNEARWERERDVAARLKDEKLAGFGYALPRGATDGPQLIPSDVWYGKISWDKGSVLGQGLEFVSVRVVPTAYIKENLAIDSTSNSETVRPGRPSVKAEIIGAYEALKVAGQIDFGISMKAHFPMIRKWLCKQYPDRSGQFSELADETIRKEFSPVFQADKKSQKQ